MATGRNFLWLSNKGRDEERRVEDNARGCLRTLRVRLRRIFPPKRFAFLRRIYQAVTRDARPYRDEERRVEDNAPYQTVTRDA